METEVDIACGMDVHKNNVVVTVVQRKVKNSLLEGKYDTTLTSLLGLVARLKELGVERVGMESTGPYWIPIHRLFHLAFEVHVGNARRMKEHSGKKTDKRDSKWIARLALNGEIEPSHVPEGEFLDLREVERVMKNLIETQSGLKNKLRHEMQLCKLDLLESNGTLSKSLLDLLENLSRGKSIENAIGAIKNKRMRARFTKELSDIAGKLSPSLLAAIGALVALIKSFTEQIERLEEILSSQLEPYQAEVDRIASVPGIGFSTASTIQCEVGNFSAFHSADAFCCWCGLVPSVSQTNGKTFYGRLMHGNRYIKSKIIQCAWVAVTRCGENQFRSYYNDMVKRGKPKGKAIVAVAHKMMKVIYHLMIEKEMYSGSRHIQTKIKRKKRCPSVKEPDPLALLVDGFTLISQT